MTPDLRAVLDAVRATGLSARAVDHTGIAPIVLVVAVSRGLNPVALQDQVNAYADEVQA